MMRWGGEEESLERGKIGHRHAKREKYDKILRMIVNSQVNIIYDLTLKISTCSYVFNYVSMYLPIYMSVYYLSISLSTCMSKCILNYTNTYLCIYV